jgi:hypothetical protein
MARGTYLKWLYAMPMSSVPHISRMLCIDSCATPTSTVRQPSADARMGPMVLPQGMSFRTQNSCGLWAGGLRVVG